MSYTTSSENRIAGGCLLGCLWGIAVWVLLGLLGWHLAAPVRG